MPFSLPARWALAAGAVLATAFAAAPNRPIPPATPEEVAHVAGAMVVEARAPAQRARRVLLTARTEGFYHSSIPVGLHALQAMAQRTGAFSVEIDHEMTAFTAENLQRFDAIIFLSTTRLEFADPAARQALLDFVANGKGIVGIHAASDNFYSWPEGQALMGGVFHSHPWLSGDTVAVKLDEPAHPLNAAFGGQGFWIKDEIYQIVGPYSRSQQRVLMSLDMSRPQNQRPADKLVRTDGDFPIGWLKSHGRGRVFYSSLGHNHEVFWTPAVLQHYLDGIQYALGDLPAPAQPSASLRPTPTPALAPPLARTLLEQTQENAELAQAFSPAHLDAIAAYSAGDDHTPLKRAERAVRQAGPQQRPQLEQALLELARRPALTGEARHAVLNWLGFIGSPASVPTLRHAAAQAETADVAVRALALIPGPAADQALLELLSAGPAVHRIAVVGALGHRRVAAALPPLQAQLTAEDTGLAGAAADALSRLGSRDAVAALRAWNPPATLREVRTWALLEAAKTLSPKEQKRAWDVVRELATRDDLPAVQQIASAEALLNLDPARALASTRPLLSRPVVGPRLTRAWLNAALAARSPRAALRPLIDDFGQLPAATQHAVLAYLAQHGGAELRPLAVAALPLVPAELRGAAFEAIAATGDLASAELLVQALAHPADRAAASAALARQNTPGLEARLRQAVTGAEPAVQAELLQILARRLDREAMPLLLAAAAGSERPPRAAAYRGIATLAKGDDLPVILSLRPQLQNADRRLWQEALRAAVRGRNDVADTLNLLQREVEAATAAERPAFLHAIAGFDDPAALQAVQQLLQHPDVERRKEMIRALSGVRNQHAFDTLMDVAEKGSDESERLLALRGYIDTLATRRERWSQTIQAYGRAYRAATRPEEREAALAGLATLESAESAAMRETLRNLPTPPATPPPSAP